MSKPATPKPDVDEILNKYKRWTIESCQPINSFNEATKQGFTEQAKSALLALHLACLPKKHTNPVVIGSFEHGFRQGSNDMIDLIETNLKKIYGGSE